MIPIISIKAGSGSQELSQLPSILSQVRHRNGADQTEVPMYLARFCYSVMPVNRDRAIALIEREVKAARDQQLDARLLIPLTRGRDGAALIFELEVPSLDAFEQFRERGLGSDQATGNWMQAFNEILDCPPEVELLRVA